ncbi:MAG: hypothetical protein IKF80_11960 [Erysipelotrichaceae bacterium]|nr:hypothetical protein [Erysipelotrichaceae bacterium]
MKINGRRQLITIRRDDDLRQRFDKTMCGMYWQVGQCVFKNSYENKNCLIHHADEVIVISRYTYGGFCIF